MYGVGRREYKIKIMVNKKLLDKVVIDPHYEEKHAGAVSDEIILELVKQLDGNTFKPADIDSDGFEYYVNDKMELEGKLYKLIWLLQDGEIYIGIVNAYRR